MDTNEMLYASPAPHFRASYSTASIMRDVIIALLPTLLFATLYFGVRALLLTIISVASAVVSEYIWEKATKQPVTIGDLSAVVTGILLAFNLPVSVPLWMPVVGSVFAIIIVKQIFGGIGQNFMNPALAGRCFLLVAWSGLMTQFTVDGVSAATPLSVLQMGEGSLPSLGAVFLGTIPGSLGETSALLLLLGGIYLVVRRVITCTIPVSYILTTLLLTYAFGGDGLYQIFCGGLMLGAIYMATDYTTSPMTFKGQLIMGIGCGVLTAIIRTFGGYPEGVSFSILLMNICVPLIDRFTVPKRFGEVKKNG